MPPVEVRTSGPFFDPTADLRVAAEIDAMRERISVAAFTRVHGLAQDFFRYEFPFPPGYTPGFYRSQIVIDRVSPDTDRIHDSRVVYGPWLEGISERNRTTRFKGYHIFRLVAQGMQQRAVDIGNEEAREIVRTLS